MVGWFTWSEGKRQVEWRTVMGLPILKVGWNMPRIKKERQWHREIARGATYLKKQGCRRVLTAPECPYGAQLYQQGLRRVDARPLCCQMGWRLVLAQLARQGVLPQYAVVLLTGMRVDWVMVQLATALAPMVRTVMIEAPHGGTQLSLRLQQDFGMAVVTKETPHVTVICSTNKVPFCQENTLCLQSGQLYLDGFRLGWSGYEGTKELEDLSLITLLWEKKKITCSEIEIFPIN